MAKKARRGAARTPVLDLSRDPVATLGCWVLVAKIVLLVVVFDPAASDTFSLPKAAVSRATTYLLAAVLIGLAVRYSTRIFRWSWIYVLAGAYLAVNAVAAAFALDRTLALYGAPIRLLGLTTLLDLGFTLFATATLVRTRADLRLVGVAFVASAVPVLAYTAVQVAGRDPVHWSDPKIFSTLGNTAHLGAYLATVSAVAVGWLAAFWRDLRGWQRSALGALALACGVALGPVGSRAPVVAIVGGIGVALGLTALRERRVPSAVLEGAVGLVALTALAVALSPAGERFRLLLTGGDPAREILWTAALQMFSAHPILGIGPDNFAAAYPALRTMRAVDVVGASFLESSPHSWILQAAVSAGILGVTALLALTAYSLYRALRLLRASAYIVPLLAGLATFLTQALFAPNEIALDALFWMALGVIVAIERLPIAPDAPPQVVAQRRQAARWRALDVLDAVGAVAVLAAVVLSISAWAPVRASEAHVAALGRLSLGDRTEALRLARDSVELDATRAQYWAGLGQVQLATGQPSSALASFERAASIAPYLSGHWRNVAETRRQLAVKDRSLLPSALDAAKRAVAAQPTDPLAHITLGHVYLDQGDRDAAIREGLSAIEIHPESAAYQLIGVAYAQMRRYDEAERIVREGADRYHRRDLDLETLLAQILIVTGRPEEARPILVLVLYLEPERDDAKALFDSLPPPPK